MGYKRRHVRVPIDGEVSLSNGQNKAHKASTFDISSGGIGVIIPLVTPIKLDKYDFNVTTTAGQEMQLTATLVHHNKQRAGFQTATINNESLQIISDLVAKYQSTNSFIEQIDKHDLLEQQFIDDAGNKVPVTFETDLKK